MFSFKLAAIRRKSERYRNDKGKERAIFADESLSLFFFFTARSHLAV
jgi:hypothetical protein